MASTKTSISYHGTVGIDEAKNILRDLLNSLDEGKVVIRRGTEHVTLTPASNVELELTGKQKKDRQSLELELSWHLEAPLEGSADVDISSEEPEPPPEPEPSEAEAEGASGDDGDDNWHTVA